MEMRDKPREPLAELEQLRKVEEQLSKVSPLMLGIKEGDNAPKTLTELAIILGVKGQAKRYLEREKELEQLMRRVAVLEKVVIENAHLCRCPHNYGMLDRYDICSEGDSSLECRDCWTAALTQAEGGE